MDQPPDANGDYLDGAKQLPTALPPDIPIKNFWLFVVDDALSRWSCRTDSPLPS